MDAMFGSLFESIGNFFTGGEQIPWCDRDYIADCEREVAESANGDIEGWKDESIMRLLSALVHSRQKEDIQRGIAILETSWANAKSSLLQRLPYLLHQREQLYLLAVGYYRSNDYGRSRQLVEKCLEIEPDSLHALSLKKIVEDRIVRGIGIAAAVGFLVGGIATALATRN